VDGWNFEGYPPRVILGLLLLLTGVSGAADGPVPAAAPTPRERLDQAVRAYQLGDQAAARAGLAELVIDPTVTDESLRQQARVYLGELLYSQGDTEGARRFFEAVLDQDRAYRVDPFVHPPDVCSYFDYVRSVTAAPPPPPPPTLLPPAPFVAWAPFGVYHLREDRTGRAVTYMSLQSTLALANIVVFGSLLTDHTYLSIGGEGEQARLEALRLTSALTTAGFYGLWFTSTIDAHIHWRRVGAARSVAAP